MVVLKLVTREKARVDRIASPWLIKRLIDPDAGFLFVPVEKVLGVARREGAISFGVEGVELGHHGEQCSFDALIGKYGFKDPALLELRRIVRGANTENRALTPESPGLVSLPDGFRIISKDEYENMRKQFPIYDTLYAFCQSKVKQQKP